MNSVLISIKPRWCEKITRGEKVIELRKTRPKINTPFKCYIYCTKGKKNDPHDLLEIHDSSGNIHKANGKVIGEFVCRRIVSYAPNFSFDSKKMCASLKLGAGLTENQLWKYSKQGEKMLYGWVISDFVLYDMPNELGEFNFPPETYCEKELCGGCPYEQIADVNGEYAFDCEWKRPIIRAPQSWCYVEERRSDNADD